MRTHTPPLLVLLVIAEAIKARRRVWLVVRPEGGLDVLD